MVIKKIFQTFPDFFKNETKIWWLNQIESYYKNTLKFDGYYNNIYSHKLKIINFKIYFRLWIDINEPGTKKNNFILFL